MTFALIFFILFGWAFELFKKERFVFNLIKKKQKQLLNLQLFFLFQIKSQIIH